MENLLKLIVEIYEGISGGIVGGIIGASITYLFGLKQLRFQNNLDNKVKMYETLFIKIRNLNTEVGELKDLACTPQLYASDEIIDFLHKQDFERGIDPKGIIKLLMLIRKDLRKKPRTLKTYVHQMNQTTANN
jgi:hypothetical protein